MASRPLCRISKLFIEIEIHLNYDCIYKTLEINYFYWCFEPFAALKMVFNKRGLNH